MWYWVGKALELGEGKDPLFLTGLILASTTGKRNPQAVRACPSNDPILSLRDLEDSGPGSA